MATLFDKLPTILVLAVLVGIFVALGRHVRTLRLKLWTVAWVLIYLHFFVGLFEPADDNLIPHSVLFLDQGFLILSALVFIASLTSFISDRKLTFSLLAWVGAPTLVYTAGLSYDAKWRWLYLLSLAAIFYGGPLFVLMFRRLNAEAAFWMPVSAIAGTFSLVHAWRGDFDFGFLTMLTAGFAFPGYFYWRRYRRWSPGVITSAGGFFLWGLVFPVGYLLDAYAPHLKINPELWNTPKFFVAFGMILTLLEDKSEYLKSATDRERKLNRQLQKFAGITSRMLTGAEISSLCQEIAGSIAETSTFRRIAIILSNETRGLALAGYAGFASEQIQQLEYKCAHVWKLDHVDELCRNAARLGQNSFLAQAALADQFGPIASTEQFEPNPYWDNGNVIVVPLRSSRGGYVGSVAMDDPRDVTSVTAEEMSKIELLAGDLAVTVDNATLHRQLVRSEKLAAIGQLVAGVAHELNNPLASIVGYSELLTDDITNGAPRQKLDKMIREAQRMRRIIENLLRFARQNNLEKKSANLHALLQEVLALREYHIRASKVDVKIEVEPDLPCVALDEDQFKQILLNLLNNSIDALETVRQKQIEIRAVRREDRVVICFEDNGPGFSEVNRVFDPFYTTKPVGKGTGLGLSICYGIVKEHGGDIQAVNRDPGGARITMELPLYAGHPIAASVATTTPAPIL
jgi:two-component system NtrC family sensor kinase